MNVELSKHFRSPVTEFLKEGAAIDDFMSPDRVLGCEDKHAETVLRHLYGSFMRTGCVSYHGCAFSRDDEVRFELHASDEDQLY